MSAGSSAPLSGAQIKALLDAIGFHVVAVYTAATLPAPGTVDALAIVSDGSGPVLYRDDGTNWVAVSPTPRPRQTHGIPGRLFLAQQYR